MSSQKPDSLRDQLCESARAAVSACDGGRAVEILARYGGVVAALQEMLAATRAQPVRSLTPPPASLTHALRSVGPDRVLTLTTDDGRSKTVMVRPRGVVDPDAESYAWARINDVA